MRIAQIAPPFVPVPPDRYGGTERVVSTLTEELVRRGHAVTLFAAGDSQTSARLVPIAERALWSDPEADGDTQCAWTVALGRVLRELDEFDIVHSHLDHVGLPLARAARCPVVTTLHGRLDIPCLQRAFREFPEAPLVSISNAQREPLPQANWAATVYHGIDLEQFTFNPRPQGHLAFLGRISPEKGLHTAIRVARRVGLPLKVAARIPLANRADPNVRRDWEYYEAVIQPLLRTPGVEFVGELGGREKDAFLGDAAALLFPVDWPEPFGLVMVEALACGTPVIALRRGSVPEVITEGVTGFVREDEDGLVEAVGRIGELDRARCRREAERRFSPAAMGAAYERVYAALLWEHAIRPLPSPDAAPVRAPLLGVEHRPAPTWRPHPVRPVVPR